MWRSLLAAREVIERGSRWIVGNGKKVKIWRDRWIPTPYTFKAVSLRSQTQEMDRVEQLIDRENGSWDAVLVRSNFLAHEAEVILGIPLSPTLPEDSLVWAWTKKGSFTVKSAYGVAFNFLKEGKKQNDKEGSSYRTKTREFRKFIWQLECPNKVKQFFWKALKNILPTNSWLASRKITKDDSCGLCGLCETSGHILWGCKFASKVWKIVGLPIKVEVQVQSEKEFIDVVWRLKEDKSVQDWESYAVTAWKIWNNRSIFKHEGHCKQPKQIAEEARNYTEECKQSITTAIRIHARAKILWKPSREGWYKVNVNGAVFSDSGSCGVGVVIRNEKGQLMGALSKRIQLPLRPLEVEAKAMEEGIQLAKDLSLKEIIIEGDAKQVVMAVTDVGTAPSSISKAIEGVRLWLQHFKS